MKSKRTPLNVSDFSGGLNTEPPQTDVDSKYSPDCLNVYAEGKALRKRFGTTKINISSTGTLGNGIYNWVLSASQQYLIGLFDSTLKQMSVSGTSWSGTWATVSADSAAGTPFSSGIMGFVTYQGTLIMTNENQDKPQRITATDTSYKNIDFGGTGVAPFGKYSQIWKEHVWLLNIKSGGQLTEDCLSLTSWTTVDVSTGVSTTASFGGLTTFRFHGGAGAGSDAHIKRNVGTVSSSYSAEIKTYFASLSNVTGGDYAWMDIYNGNIRFRTRWSQDGLEVLTGGTVWNQIGVGLVSTGAWITWKFLVTANTATAAVVSVLQNGAPAGIQFSVANVVATSNGQIDITAAAGGSSSRSDWYMDYLYINPIVAKIDYITNGSYESAFVGGLPPNWVFYPTQSFLEYKLNDNAGNSTITDNGTGANNGGMYSSNTTINTSAVSVAGKIGQAISFTSASSHNIQMASATITTIATDIVGGISLWIKPNSAAGYIFSISRATGQSNVLYLSNNGAGLNGEIIKDNITKWQFTTNNVVSDGSWNHIVLSQNGVTPVVYVNNSVLSTSFVNVTDITAWIASMGTVDTGRIGTSSFGAGGNTNYFNGVIDDVRYYRTALSSFDVATLYAEGNGTEGFPLITQNTNTAFIKLGTASLQVANSSNYVVQSQTLTSGTAIAGVPSYIGSWFYVTNGQTYKFRVNDGTNNFDSAIFTGNGTFQYQTFSFTPGSDATAVNAQVVSLSSGTMYVDQTSLITSAVGITQDFSDRLQRSVSGTYDTWTGGDSGSNDITTPQDVGLTGSFILQDRMYVTKAWNIYRITYTGSIPLLDIKQARSVVGSKSSRAIKNIDLPGVGEVVIFLGTDRNLYLFDGFASSNLTDMVQLNNNMASVYMNNINTQAFDKIFAVNHSNLGWYEIFLPIGNSTVPNFSLVYNYKTKAFWPFDNRNFLSGNVSDDGSGERVVIVAGASDGNIYEINSDKGTSDAGTAINAYWNSFKLGEDYILAKQDEVRIATDSVTATPYIKWRTNYETSYVSKTLSANTNSYVYDPTREGNLFQFQIGDYSTGAIWKFWHVKVLEKGLGIGQ